MTVSSHAYANLAVTLANKEVDLDSDTLKVMLLTSAYTPNQGTHKYKSDVVASELSTTSTTTAASSIAGATTLSSTASIAVGNMILIDTAGLAEARVVTAVSGSGPYTLTVAALINAHASGVAIVANSGYTAGGQTLSSVTVVRSGNTVTLDAADTVWTGSTINARYAVIYDSTPATDATRPLISYQDAGADIPSMSGPWTATWDATGIVIFNAS